MRQLAEELGLTAGSGSWARRVAQFAAGQLGASGSWTRRLKESGTVSTDNPSGSWLRRLGGQGDKGSWARRLAEGDEGFDGGYPEWLPLDPNGLPPVVYADFKEGRYWADGAEATVEALFYEDPNWWNYSPEDSIVAGKGLVDGGPLVDQALAAAILSGEYSVVMTVQVNEIMAGQQGLSAYSMAVDLPSFSSNLVVQMREDTLSGEADLSGKVFVSPGDIGLAVVVADTVAGKNKLAFNAGSASQAISHNGGAAVETELEIGACNNLGPAHDPQTPNALESWAVYPHLQDEADLPSMSAL